MNLRMTTLLFALLLSTLWVFGWMVQYKRAGGEESSLSPSFSSTDAGKIKQITIEKTKDKDAPKVVFKEIDDSWYNVVGDQKAKVEGFRIKNIIDQLKSAKNDDTEKISGSPKSYDLEPPQMTVEIEGEYKGDAKTWKFFIGKESKDGSLVYAAASDRQDKVFAVPVKHVEGLRFKDPKYLRSKRPFDFVDTAVTGVQVKKAADRLEVKQDDGLWKILAPPLGYAGPFDVSSPEEKKDLLAKEASISSVKSLLNALQRIHVEDDDDFEPLGKKTAADYGLGKDPATMKIDVVSGGDKEKKGTTDTLYIGNKVEGAALRDRKEVFYYAKLAAPDDGVMQISAKMLEGLDKLLQEPGKLRSHDIAFFDSKSVDYVVIKQGSTEFKFYKTEAKDAPLPPFHPKFGAPPTPTEWHLYIDKAKQKASAQAVDKLIDHVLGRQAIVDFLDKDADIKKYDAETPAAEITVYLNAVEKKEEKDKKDDKTKKEEDKTKKEEDKTKKDEPPKLNEKLKVAAILALGKTEKDKEQVPARRTLEEGKVKGWFTLKKEFVEKILPPEGILLAYSDLSLPTFPIEDTVAIRIKRTTERGTEDLEFTRSFIQGRTRWYVKQGAGYQLANSDGVNRIVGMLEGRAKKLIKKIDEKEDLDKYGLKTPGVVVTVTTKKQPLSPDAISALKKETLSAGAIGGLLSFLGASTPVDALSYGVALGQTEKSETFTLEFGNDTTEEKDKPGTFAKHSGSKMLLLVPAHLVRQIKEMDLRDRVTATQYQPELEALYRANTAFNPFGVLMFASPHFTGQVHNLDVDKIKEVHLVIRTPAERRSLDFIRNPKDKEKDKDKPWTWTNVTAPKIEEFQLDSEKVNQLVKDFAKLHVENPRFAEYSLPPKDAKDPKAPDPLAEFKLTPEECTVKLDLVTEDDKGKVSTVTLTVGMNPSQLNLGYYARTSLWGDVVFFLPRSKIQPLLEGPSQFAKERFTGN